MENLLSIKSDFDILSSISKNIKKKKTDFKNLQKIIKETKKYYPVSNPTKIISSILKYILPIKNFYGLTRNKEFSIWGFEKYIKNENIKKMKNNLNSIYLMLETLHSCKIIDLEYKKIEKYEIDMICKNLFLEFDSDNIFCLSFKNNYDNFDNNVFLIFEIEVDNLCFFEFFFFNDFFKNFRNYFFRKLFGIFIKINNIDYNKKKFCKEISKIEYYLTIFSFEFFIFENSFKKNFLIKKINLDDFKNPYFSLNFENYDISIIGKTENSDLKYNLFKKKNQIENIFENYFNFLENYLENLNTNLKNEKCCYLFLNLNNEVIYYKNQIDNNSVFFENRKFENYEKLNFYIKKEKILEEIKKFSNRDFFLDKKILFKKIVINDIEIKILPNFIFKNKKNFKNGFIIKIKNLFENEENSDYDNSDLDNSSIESSFSINKKRDNNYLEVKKKNKNWENEYSEKKSLEISENDNNSLNMSSISSGLNYLNSKDNKSKSKNNLVKINYSEMKKKENLSSLEKLKLKKIHTFEIKQDAIILKDTINKKEEFLKKIINSNKRKSKYEENLKPIDELMSKIKHQLDNKLNLIESLNTLELSIDQTIKDLKVEKIEDTIFVEYVKSNKFSKQGSLYPHKAQVLKRKSVIPDYFRKSSNFSYELIKEKNNTNQNLFEIYKSNDLLKYQIDFLSEKSKKKKFNTVYTMFKTSGIIEQYNVDLKIFYNFLEQAEIFYSKYKNAYHNFEHGLTVLNGCYYFLMNSNAHSFFDDTGVAAFLFGSFMHDVDHPGHNNDFEINSYGDLALFYNNQHVLENHHCFTAFKILKKNNFFENMESKNEFMVFRKITIELILMTDPKHHLEHLNKLEKLIEKTKKEEFKENVNFDNFIALAGVMVHAADLHGPVKKLSEAKKWSSKIKIEFLDQLEKEENLGIPVTGFFKDLNNNKKSLINEIFFIGNIVKPLYVVIDDFFEGSFGKEVNYINSNLSEWKRELENIIKKEKEDVIEIEVS